MAKFEIIQDCSVEGTNITPYGSEMPNFHLTYHFHRYEVVESMDEQEQFIEVETTSGIFNDGSVYNGACRFFIPKEYVRLVDEEIPLPPAPPEEAIPAPPVEVRVVNGEQLFEHSISNTYSEPSSSSVRIDYQPIKKGKSGIPVKLIAIGIFVIAIIWMFLANC